MAFPATPTLNDTHTEAGTNYWFDGTTWMIGSPPPVVPASSAPLVPPHDPAVSYLAGQTVRHGTDLVAAKTDLPPEAWTATHWDSVGGGGAGAGVTMSETAPTTPANGMLWYRLSDSFLFIYRTDVASWIQLF